MNFEDTKLFKLITTLVAFAGTWWLCSLVHLEPFGSGSVAAFAVFVFCLFGIERFLDTLFGIAAAAVFPTRTRTAR